METHIPVCVLGWYSLPAARTPVVRVSRFSVLSLLVSFPRCVYSYFSEVAISVAATIIPHEACVLEIALIVSSGLPSRSDLSMRPETKG